MAALAGTTAFTFFSYLVSKTMNKDFKEPELLGKMVERVTPELGEKESQFTGWLIHYLTGIAFVGAYKLLIDITGIKPSAGNGMVIGATSGLPAALIWDTALKLHPAPPRKPSANYYLHLGLGHMILGATSFFVLGLFDTRKKPMHYCNR